jgi:multicomponent Na+:H+ antiporter subunit D
MFNPLAPVPILIPLGTAFILPFVSRFVPSMRAMTCILALIVTLAVLLTMAGPVFGGATIVYWMSEWKPRDGLAIGISLSIDAWGLLIALVIVVISLAATIYSIAYMRTETGKGSYYVLLLLLTTGLVGFCLSGDVFNQFVWLEVFSVASFALTGFHTNERQAVEAAFKYLITNSVASFFIAVALALLYLQTGALNLAQIARDFQPTAAGLVAVGLIVGGYATKAALFPWHFWLPDAHTVAPAPISALFSGVLIKVGLYAVARNLFVLLPSFQGSFIQYGVLLVAALSMLIGGVQMLQQKSPKRILALSSVAQVGYIAMGFGLGTAAGFAAAAMHIVHHALVKSGLFLGVGAVIHRTHIHSIDEGGGFARQMPITCTLMCLGMLSLAGMPFFSGFISKTLLEEAAIAAGFAPLAWIAILASMTTFAGVFRLLWGLFGPRRSSVAVAPDVREPPFLMWFPIMILIVGSILVGLFPAWVSHNLTNPAAIALVNREHYIAATLQSATPPSPAHEEEAHFEEPPSPFDIKHWAIPLIVVIGGGLLAYIFFNPDAARRSIHAVFRVGLYIGHLGRRLHSGLLSDYVLWNAFGTAVLVIGLLLARRFG